MARLTRVAGNMRWFSRMPTITYPSTNRAQHQLTLLIKTNVLTTTVSHYQSCTIAKRPPLLWASVCYGLWHTVIRNDMHKWPEKSAAAIGLNPEGSSLEACNLIYKSI